MNSKNFAAMISSPLEKLVYRDSNPSEIRLVIARTVNHNGSFSPNNYSRQYDDPKDCTGGCFARIFATHDGDAICSWYGPEISYGNLADFETAVRGMKLIQKRMDQMRVKRGSTNDACVLLGRFVEAAGVLDIYIAQDNKAWLHEGKWDIVSTGALVNRLKQFMPSEKINAS